MFDVFSKAVDEYINYYNNKRIQKRQMNDCPFCSAPSKTKNIIVKKWLTFRKIWIYNKGDQLDN